jgi:hypothetical protein
MRCWPFVKVAAACRRKEAPDPRRGRSEGALESWAARHGGSRHVGVEPVEGTRLFWRYGASRAVSYRQPRSGCRCGGEPSPREHVPVTVGARGQSTLGDAGRKPDTSAG